MNNIYIFKRKKYILKSVMADNIDFIIREANLISKENECEIKVYKIGSIVSNSYQSDIQHVYTCWNY